MTCIVYATKSDDTADHNDQPGSFAGIADLGANSDVVMWLPGGTELVASIIRQIVGKLN